MSLFQKNKVHQNEDHPSKEKICGVSRLGNPLWNSFLRFKKENYFIVEILLKIFEIFFFFSFADLMEVFSVRMQFPVSYI